MKILSIFLATVAGINGLLSAAGAFASDNELTQTEVRKLVDQGEILPLKALLDRQRALLNGRLLDLEVERDDSTVVYELEILKEDGQVIEYKIDAATGRLLKQKVED